MSGLNAFNAAILAPALARLPWSAARVEAELENANLSGHLAHQQTGLVPLAAGAEFIFRLGDLTREPTFAFDAIMGFRDLDPHHCVGIPLPLGETGLPAADAFVHVLDGAVSNVHFYRRLVGDRYWIFRTTGSTAVSETWPLTQYNQAVVLRGMRRIFGPDLRPVAMETGLSQVPPDIPENLRDIPIAIGCHRSGLGFALADLTRRRANPGNAMRSGLSGRADFTHLKSASAETVTACIYQFLSGGQTENLADRVAAGFGVSLRSYQRALSRMGTTHIQLRDRARLAAAMEGLKDDRRSVTAVALDLGYAHAGDFTRFFRNQTGQTPSQHRRFL